MWFGGAIGQSDITSAHAVIALRFVLLALRCASFFDAFVFMCILHKHPHVHSRFTHTIF
jgi:hypothetical protein